jgi:hypothetical protein
LTPSTQTMVLICVLLDTFENVSTTYSFFVFEFVSVEPREIRPVQGIKMTLQKITEKEKIKLLKGKNNSTLLYRGGDYSIGEK